MEPTLNWEKPQRQPLAGLLIVFIKTFWEIFKRVWPLLLLSLFNNDKDKPDNGDKWEWLVVVTIGLTIIGSTLKYFYFRFSILNEELIIQKGWLKKTTVTIPLQKIQTIHIEQSFLHQLLGIVKAKIDTAGSSNTEASIDALHVSMAKALQSLVQRVEHKDKTADNKELSSPLPLLTLGTKDLWRLSISANHVEAFFILLSFGYGVYDNIKQVSEKWISDASVLLPPGTLFFMSILTILILIVTILISVTRIFLKFYGYTVWQQRAGIYIKGGLANVKEQLVPFSKIQYITWRANWIRSRLQLLMLEYKVASNDEFKVEQKAVVPITQVHYIHSLMNGYAPIPSTESITPIRIHSSFVIRRLLIYGILPALVLIPLLWIGWQEKALLLLFIPVLSGMKAAVLQKRFRLYLYSDVVYLNHSSYGSAYTLLRWHKIQKISLNQSLYQHKRGLASVLLHTASGNVSLPYISSDAAQAIVNYALYQVEHKERAWM